MTTSLFEIIDLKLMWESLPFVLEGLSYTLSISLLSFILSLIFGTILAIIRLFKIPLLSQVAGAYISFFRGVPALVVLFFLYFGFPFIGILLNAYVASIIGLTLTSTAYSAEIMRSAIMSVDEGQWDAGKALGFSFRPLFWHIILPQAGRIALPPMSNVLLDLVKGTSLTAMITVPDIFQRAKIVGGSQSNFISMYLLVGIIYWLICWLYEQLQKVVERRLNITEKPIKMQSMM